MVKLRKDWLKFVKKVLSGEVGSGRLVDTFHKKKEREKKTSVSYGFYEVPARNLGLFVFYEEGVDEKYIDALREKLSYILGLRVM